MREYAIRCDGCGERLASPPFELWDKSRGEGTIDYESLDFCGPACIESWARLRRIALKETHGV